MKTETPETDKVRDREGEILLRAIRMTTHAERLERERDHYKQDHLRYEALKKLNINEVYDLYLRDENLDYVMDEFMIESAT